MKPIPALNKLAQAARRYAGPVPDVDVFEVTQALARQGRGIGPTLALGIYGDFHASRLDSARQIGEMVLSVAKHRLTILSDARRARIASVVVLEFCTPVPCPECEGAGCSECGHLGGAPFTDRKRAAMIGAAGSAEYPARLRAIEQEVRERCRRELQTTLHNLSHELDKIGQQ